jgi:hypothetical protein
VTNVPWMILALAMIEREKSTNVNSRLVVELLVIPAIKRTLIPKLVTDTPSTILSTMIIHQRNNEFNE